MIEFDDKNHRYTRNDKDYISATTLINKYVPPFAAEYWATYKAVKDVLSDCWEWSDYKWNAGGWERVVDFFRCNGAGAYDAEIHERKQYYLDLWEANSQEARDKGSLVHKTLEESTLSQKVEIHYGETLLKPSQMGLLALQNFAGDGAFPELKVFNDEYEIAGTVDLVRKLGKTVHITDYKTCTEISAEAFRDERLLFPLEHIPNSDFHKYSLQVSLYAWILEECGFGVGTLTIEHRDKNTGKLITCYPVEYCRNDIVLMLDHYKNA